MKEKICAVYKIENLNNRKIYVGSSRNYYSRRASHETALRHDHHISREMQKDFNNGDKFDFSISRIFPEQTTDEDLSKAERDYIIRYDSVQNGYNTSTPGGTGRDKQRQIERQNKYVAEKYDRFTATFPKGKKEEYREHAESKGLSLNGLINELLEEDIHKDGDTE